MTQITETFPGITYLYVIHSTSGYYKIGISSNPDKRIKSIDRGALTPFVNSFICLIPFSDGKAAEMEKVFHDKFSDKRVNGEWFDLSPFDVAFFAKLEATIGDYWIAEVARQRGRKIASEWELQEQQI